MYSRMLQLSHLKLITVCFTLLLHLTSFTVGWRRNWNVRQKTFKKPVIPLYTQTAVGKLLHFFNLHWISVQKKKSFTFTAGRSTPTNRTSYRSTSTINFMTLFIVFAMANTSTIWTISSQITCLKVNHISFLTKL